MSKGPGDVGEIPDMDVFLDHVGNHDLTLLVSAGVKGKADKPAVQEQASMCTLVWSQARAGMGRVCVYIVYMCVQCISTFDKFYSLQCTE